MKRQRQTRAKIVGSVRVNAYAVVSRAVEEGVGWGYSRAHKHVEHPDEDALKRAMEDAVTNALSEVLNYDEPQEDAPPRLRSFVLLRAAMQRALERGWGDAAHTAKRAPGTVALARDDLIVEQLRHVMGVLHDCLSLEDEC